MTFWNSVNTEPKRDYRWVGQAESILKGETYKIPQWTMRSFTAPQYKQKVTPIFNNNVQGLPMMVPGEVGWESITMEAYDFASESYNNTATLHEWLRIAKPYLSSQNGASGPPEPMTSTDDNTRWLLTVSRINSSGGLAEKWTFTGAMIEKIEFGSNYDYNSDGFSLVKMTWGITNAWLTVGEAAPAAARVPEQAPLMAMRRLPEET